MTLSEELMIKADMQLRSEGTYDDELMNFKNLFLEFYRPLCLFSKQIVADIDVAKDIVQDVFADIWDTRNEIDFERSIKPLLYKYTRNKSLDYLKKMSSQDISLSEWTDNYSLELFVSSMYLFQQEETLHSKDLKVEIDHCISNLPNQCRNVYTMSRECGLKNREIADKLNITVKAVEKQISKALSSIREHLTQKGFLELFLFFLYYCISDFK